MVDRITFCQRTWSTIHFPSMVSSICLNTLLWLFSTPVYPMQSILFYLALNFPKCSPFVRHNYFNTGRSEVSWGYLKTWSRYIPLWNLLLLAHISKSLSSLTLCLTFLFFNWARKIYVQTCWHYELCTITLCATFIPGSICYAN